MILYGVASRLGWYQGCLKAVTHMCEGPRASPTLSVVSLALTLPCSTALARVRALAPGPGLNHGNQLRRVLDASLECLYPELGLGKQSRSGLKLGVGLGLGFG